MSKANDQVQDLLNEFRAVNNNVKNYLNEMTKKIAELDMKYAQQLVRNDINILKSAKSILQNKRK